MASSIFPEKDFSRILNDLNGYGHIFGDRLGKKGGIVLFMITDVDMFYCLDLVR